MIITQMADYAVNLSTLSNISIDISQNIKKVMKNLTMYIQYL